MIQSSAAAIILPRFPTQSPFHFPSKSARGGHVPPLFISNPSGALHVRCRSTSSVQARLPEEASSVRKHNQGIEPNFPPFRSSNSSSTERGDDDADSFVDVDNLLYLLRFSTKYSDVELVRAVHASILKIEEDTHLGNVLIGAYLKLGLVLDAYQVFKNLSEPNVVSYSSLISGFAKSNREFEAAELFFRMRSSGVEPNEYSFVAILTACVRASRFELGCQVHALGIKMGFTDYVFVANALMALYGKSGGCLDSAIQLFEEMPERDITSWNTVISSLVDGSLYEKALKFGRDLVKINEFRVDELTLLTLLTACTGCHAVKQGKEIHGHATRLGLAASLSLCNAMIGFYSKCGTIENALTVFDTMQIRDVITWTQLISAYMEFGLVDSAVKTFEKMPERNAISYNAILSGFSHNSQGLNALNFFTMMVRNGVELSDFSLTSVITACGLLADLETSRQIHGFVTKFGYGSNAHIEASLLDMYTRCGRMRDAEILYSTQNNPIVLTSMMSGYARNGQPDEAISHFHRSLSEGKLAMDEAALTTALGVCGALGFRELGKQIHSFVVKAGFEADVGVGNSLVSMYSKCGEMDEAIKSFDAMSARDVVSWNSLIAGHVLHREGDKALALWSSMEKAGVRPDSITFVLLISAYKQTSSDLVDHCRTMFLSMKPTYGIEPASEHYASFVGVLGSWGFVEEAEEMILELPFEPDVSIWRALLDSCRLHVNTTVGRRVAKRILAMEPRDPSTFVLISNLYSASGRWHCAEATRQEMREKGMMRKQPCRSWIIHENEIHSFHARDVSHPQSMDIYRGLEVLILECMRAGYEPDTSFVLQEVEEHQKKEFLFYHSAKLAATYGLLMTSPGEVIRVVKNVVVCGDCHSFLKHVSAVAGREISLRDGSGFHFFSDGQCSCRDYW
ncbi:unnamed protein product [Linum trigynum]|uniref:DYW domain-containing protein n=1 Tax=Linum trigynum TaxID=586398 RepID=A0AAV2DGT2_9ROSI